MVEGPPSKARDSGWIPGSGRSPGEGKGNTFQCSCLQNPMDREASQAIAHRDTKDVGATVTKQRQ